MALCDKTQFIRNWIHYWINMMLWVWFFAYSEQEHLPRLLLNAKDGYRQHTSWKRGKEGERESMGTFCNPTTNKLTNGPKLSWTWTWEFLNHSWPTLCTEPEPICTTIFLIFSNQGKQRKYKTIVSAWAYQNQNTAGPVSTAFYYMAVWLHLAASLPERCLRFTHRLQLVLGFVHFRPWLLAAIKSLWKISIKDSWLSFFWVSFRPL